jgi:hypothetical protein
MAYGKVVAAKSGRQIVITASLPEEGELSRSGRAENLVDPRPWLDADGGGGQYRIKLTICRPLAGPRLTR